MECGAAHRRKSRIKWQYRSCAEGHSVFTPSLSSSSLFFALDILHKWKIHLTDDLLLLSAFVSSAMLSLSCLEICSILQWQTKRWAPREATNRRMHATWTQVTSDKCTISKNMKTKTPEFWMRNEEMSKATKKIHSDRKTDRRESFEERMKDEAAVFFFCRVKCKARTRIERKKSQSNLCKNSNSSNFFLLLLLFFISLAKGAGIYVVNDCDCLLQLHSRIRVAIKAELSTIFNWKLTARAHFDAQRRQHFALSFGCAWVCVRACVKCDMQFTCEREFAF